MQSIANDKSLGNRTRGQLDSQRSEAESESSLQSARTARCAIATRWRRHTVSKNYFVPVLTMLVCLFLRHGDALDDKRSFSDHASTKRGLQFWTLCATKHSPTRHRRWPRHRRWGRCRCCRRPRRPSSARVLPAARALLAARAPPALPQLRRDKKI